MTFPEQLKSLRKQHGLTREQAAAVLKDVSASWIDKAESGKRIPHVWMRREAIKRLQEYKP